MKVTNSLSDFFNDNFYKQIKDLVEKSQGFTLENFQNSGTMRKVFDKEIKKGLFIPPSEAKCSNNAPN